MKKTIYLMLAICGTGMAEEIKPEVHMTWSGQAEASRNLVNLHKVNDSIVLDIRYATTNNFTGVKVYESPTCYIHKDAAAALNRVQKHLSTMGLGLKVFDGYRPLWSQQMLWDVFPDSNYVAPPQKGGRHTRGTAVDLTLIDLATGEELWMPTPFDDFTTKAHRDCTELDAKQIANRELLEQVMVEVGHFEPYFFEWWHFDFSGWKEYTPMNIGFGQLQVRDAILDDTRTCNAESMETTEL